MTFFAMDEKRLAENFAKQNLKSLALNYFDSVNTMMLTGTVLNRQIIQEKNSDSREYRRSENYSSSSPN